MNALNTKALLIGLVMLVAAGLAMALTPTKRLADLGPKIDLETLIPQTFNGWVLDNSITPLVANPTQEAMLDQIYSQTLSRTYINAQGQRIMLSIAYGEDQNRELQVHRPEVCYPAQGFMLLSKEKALLHTSHGEIPVMRLVAQQGQRQEPIIYWIRFGETLVRGNLEQGFARLSHGLRGLIADALLVRVSSLSSNTESAYAAQEQFIKDLLAAVAPNKRNQLLGKKDG